MKLHYNFIKRVVVLALLVAMGVGEALAYDIYIGSGSKRLYFNIDRDKMTAVVTYPGDSNNYWISGRHTQPTDSLVIPSTITYQGNTYVVTAIGNNAFTNCARIKHVIIGDSITAIGDYAFQYCSMIRSVSLPAGLTSIGTSAFESCIALKKLDLPAGLSSIGEGAFALCRQLDSIVIPASLTHLPNHLFYSCNGLMTISLPSNLSQIGDFTFRECNGLRTIDLPNTITRIGGSAFSDCSNLQYIYLPESVDTIKAYTFRNCSRLTRVRIPASVSRIEGNAFANNGALADIVVLNTEPPFIGLNAFQGVDRSIAVHIPCGGSAAYTAADGWNEFTNMIEYPGYKLEYAAADTSMGTVVVEVEPTCTDSTAVVRAEPFARYAFTRWHDGDTTNPRTVDVTVDSVLIAYFHYVGPNGIDDANSLQAAIVSYPGSIQISGAAGQPIKIYEISGRQCHTIDHAAATQRLAVDHAGVYLVQIGNQPARKVVVYPAQ